MYVLIYNAFIYLYSYDRYIHTYLRMYVNVLNTLPIIDILIVYLLMATNKYVNVRKEVNWDYFGAVSVEFI